MLCLHKHSIIFESLRMLHAIVKHVPSFGYKLQLPYSYMLPHTEAKKAVYMSMLLYSIKEQRRFRLICSFSLGMVCDVSYKRARLPLPSEECPYFGHVTPTSQRGVVNREILGFPCTDSLLPLVVTLVMGGVAQSIVDTGRLSPEFQEKELRPIFLLQSGTLSTLIRCLFYLSYY